MKHNNILLSTLTALWLSEVESHIYLVCLEYWSIPASTIAKYVAIPRTTVYNYTTHLLKKQVLIETKNNSGTLYGAQHPDIIISLLKQEQNRLWWLVTQIEDIKDTLLSLSHTSEAIPKVKYYQWIESIQATYEKYVQANNWFAYFDVTVACKHLWRTPEQAANIFSHVQWSIKELVVDNDMWRQYASYIKNPNHAVKFLSQENTFLTDTICFDGIIHYISFDNTKLVVEIKHENIFQSHKNIFMALREKIE